MYYEVLLTQDEYNTILSALREAIRKCYETPKEDQEMVKRYKHDLEVARFVLLQAEKG